LDVINFHKADISNPHAVSAAQTGAATTAALAAHTSNKSNPHVVTATQTGAPTVSAFNTHTGNTDNPHGVTAVQVGAATPSDVNTAIANIDFPDFGVGDIPNGSITLNKMGTVVITGSASINKDGYVTITSGPCSLVGGMKCPLAGGAYTSLNTGYSPHYVTIFKVVVGSLGYYKPTLNFGNPRVMYGMSGGGSASWEKYIIFDLDGTGGTNGTTLYWKVYQINE